MYLRDTLHEVAVQMVGSLSSSSKTTTNNDSISKCCVLQQIGVAAPQRKAGVDAFTENLAALRGNFAVVCADVRSKTQDVAAFSELFQRMFTG